jgi:hypothetical protein
LLLSLIAGDAQLDAAAFIISLGAADVKEAIEKTCK